MITQRYRNVKVDTFVSITECPVNNVL
jgi:hypothetical protein